MHTRVPVRTNDRCTLELLELGNSTFRLDLVLASTTFGFTCHFGNGRERERETTTKLGNSNGVQVTRLCKV
jgi:hypothetical protein